MSETKFKVGDTVTSLIYGNGKITAVSIKGDVDVHFEYANLRRWYSGDGYPDDKAIRPEIYHTEPQITIPKRKIKREVKRYVYAWYIPETFGVVEKNDEFSKEITLSWTEEIEG